MVFCFVLWQGIIIVALAGLKFTVYTNLASESQNSTCLCHLGIHLSLVTTVNYFCLPLLFGNKSIWVFPFRNNSWSSPSFLFIPQLWGLLTWVLASVPLHLQHAHYTEIAAVLPNYEPSYVTHPQDQKRNNSLFPGCMLCIATTPLLMPPFLSSSALYSPLCHCSWSLANSHPRFY